MNYCLYPGCQCRAYARSLCIKHYRAARCLVLSNKISWEELERQGKCTTSKMGRPSECGWFLQGVDKVEEKTI